jgi:hypothetical protein
VLWIGHTVPAQANVPDPTTSTCDTCLVISPDGTGFQYRVIVRDDTSAPVVGATVNIHFNAVSGITLCTESDVDGDGVISGVTDAQGIVDFNIHGGGASVDLARVSSQGATLCFARVKSPDLNGDLMVTSQDESDHAALSSTDLSGDYDCNGVTDISDRAEIANRIGAECSPVQVDAETWGRVKSLYR